MWIDYAIAFGGIALFAAICGIIHTILVNQMRAERDAERAKGAGHT